MDPLFCQIRTIFRGDRYMYAQSAKPEPIPELSLFMILRKRNSCSWLYLKQLQTSCVHCSSVLHNKHKIISNYIHLHSKLSRILIFGCQGKAYLPSRKQNMMMARMIAMMKTTMSGKTSIRIKSLPKSLADESYTGATYVDSSNPSPLTSDLVALLTTTAVSPFSICWERNGLFKDH